MVYSLNTLITLTLNDFSEQKIKTVQSYIEDLIEKENPDFKVSFQHMDASILMLKLLDRLKIQPKTTRNLIFIDPYGYKHIDKNLLSELLSNGRTEVIIFLPISHMYRFTGKVKSELTESSYIPLKKFISQFGIDLNKVNNDKELIKQIEISLRFGNNYKSTSYHIKKQQGNHYALFFITSHIYGLEKVLEVKWELDEQQGEGFHNQPQRDLFLELEKLDTFRDSVSHYIKTPKNNNELYEFTLINGFLPRHINGILKNLQQSNKISITPQDTRKGSFYINKTYYQDKQVKVLIEIIP